LLLAPLAICLAALALEASAAFLANGFTFGSTGSPTRLAGGKFVLMILILMLVLFLDWPMYQMSLN
jgi:hypothetical protein